VGLDYRLAHICSCDSCCNFLAREVQEGAAVVLDSPVGVAFLECVCGTLMAPVTDCQFLRHTLDDEEALIEEYFPKNIARW
jgi:hypothetical protein